MGIISWIVLGLVVGAIAKLIVGGRDASGCILTTLLGIAGAFVGGFVGRTLFHVRLGTFFEWRTWLLSILGAVIILVLYHAIRGGRLRR